MLIGIAMVLAACSSDGGGDGGVGDSGGGGEADGGDNGGGGGAPDASPLDGDEPQQVAGCDGAMLYETPADPGARGPWPVGARTVRIGRLTVEVWYPAERGSQAGAERAVYDIRKALPMSQQAVIPDADNPWQECNCYRDLPLDEARGPYPVVVFVHGTASFRTQSLTQMTHWASRGFVVLSADHPGLMLADSLALLCPDAASGHRDPVGDVNAMLAALDQPAGELAFLAGTSDRTRVGVAGHSAGAGAAASVAGSVGVRVVIPMAGNASVGAVGGVESRLFLGGTADGVAQYSGTVSAYESAASPKRLVGLENGGHLIFADLCELQNGAGQNMLEIAQAYGVCGTEFASFLFDCSPELLDGPTGWAIVSYATTAVLEGVLHCNGMEAAFADLESRFPDVSELRESP